MLAQFIIPKQFSNNIWFKMAAVQAYITIFSALMFFGRDLILSEIVK